MLIHLLCDTLWYVDCVHGCVVCLYVRVFIWVCIIWTGSGVPNHFVPLWYVRAVYTKKWRLSSWVHTRQLSCQPLGWRFQISPSFPLQHTAIHRHTLQHTATNCNGYFRSHLLLHLVLNGVEWPHSTCNFDLIPHEWPHSTCNFSQQARPYSKIRLDWPLFVLLQTVI